MKNKAGDFGFKINKFHSRGCNYFGDEFILKIKLKGKLSFKLIKELESLIS